METHRLCRSINVAYDPSGPEVLSFAAEELRFYLSRMLPNRGEDIEIRLGVYAGDPAENDAFRVDISPRGGVVAGNSGRAVLLGVYDLLRTMGCRFPAPGPRPTARGRIWRISSAPMKWPISLGWTYTGS